jgi:hypothetical protein
MLSRIILAVVVAVVAYLICLFVGGVLLVSLGVPIAVAVGRFLVQWATVISVLAALWFFFAGGGLGPIRLR